ncbi:MmgE/PrpD family protein [Devosia sp. Root635]|uniref:MmgE/PrpD family protein n=1 Tax=Devosia sp. Root635 TaxID=1736575 RepID=UPI000A71F2D3|nr:MmgE/PrpD family protein [Devosia sp. Root635]
MTVSAALTDFVAASRWEDIPAPVRHEAKRALLSYFGTALGGSRDIAIQHLQQVLSRFSGPAEAGVIGHQLRLDMLNAAFLNAAASNVFDFDDTHDPTIIHPTAPIAPVLFALAEQRPVSGRDLLHAFILGVEIECRIGNAISPEHYARGWHITSTCGVFGAAMAAGKLLDLDARHLVWALGSASSQASGLVETLGTMAKSVGVGGAARGGLFAALLAEQGLAGPDEPIAGMRGFARVSASSPDFSRIMQGLGESWEILANMVKPYPCGVVLNAVIDAAMALRDRLGASVPDLAYIEVVAHPLLRQRTDRPVPLSGREAQVSAHHAVAVTLLHGLPGLDQFSDAWVDREDVIALRGRVHLADDAALPVGTARLFARTNDGRVFRVEIAEARGSRSRPLSDAEIEEKLRQLCQHGCPGLDPSPLIDAVWSLDDAADAGALMRLARPR